MTNTAVRINEVVIHATKCMDLKKKNCQMKDVRHRDTFCMIHIYRMFI